MQEIMREYFIYEASWELRIRQRVRMFHMRRKSYILKGVLT